MGGHAWVRQLGFAVGAVAWDKEGLGKAILPNHVGSGYMHTHPCLLPLVVPQSYYGYGI